MTTNILIAGVGGQGLVLATRIVGGVAFRAGLQVKTCDVIGLAQRGGMVWGSVRFGHAVHSPLIPEGQGDFLLAMEELEGLRWVSLLKAGAVVVLSRETILPNRALLEKDDYPKDVPAQLATHGLKTVCVEANSIARQLGNKRLANTVLLGALSNYLPFAPDTWLEVLRESVPSATIELNEAAFGLGRTPSL
ncbi:MAG: hypothetical protein DDT37_01103 [Firmicutes bacterium]|nr:hypothetical protein [candidate division NPL-UPA2 bacterium]MBT9156119.1 hypothetical protein [candidate division NPL-UPA2 bacterium]